MRAQTVLCAITQALCMKQFSIKKQKQQNHSATENLSAKNIPRFWNASGLWPDRLAPDCIKFSELTYIDS